MRPCFIKGFVSISSVKACCTEDYRLLMKSYINKAFILLQFIITYDQCWMRYECSVWKHKTNLYNILLMVFHITSKVFGTHLGRIDTRSMEKGFTLLLFRPFLKHSIGATFCTAFLLKVQPITFIKPLKRLTSTFGI